MPNWLKQSTAVDIAMGPFLDETDGKTAETGLTITQPDIRLKKNGGAWAQKNAAQTLSHEENGWYEVALDTTDTNTLGILLVAIHESGALPVWREFLVVPANIYDSVVSGSDLLDVSTTQLNGSAVVQSGGRPEVNTTHWNGTAVTTPPAVNVTQISGDGTAADNAESFFDGTGYPGTGNVIPTVTTLTGHTPQTGDAYAVVNSGTHGNAALKTLIDAIDDFIDTEVAAIKAKTDNLPSDPADQSLIIAATDTILSKLLKYFQLALRKDAAIATDNATELTAINADEGSGAGAFVSTTDSQEAIRDHATTIKTETASILEDTGTTIPALIAALNNLSAAQVNAEMVDALATDTYAEPTGVPGATVALSTKIGYLYMALRNAITVTATKKQFLDDGGAAEWEKDLSDDGTTYTESEGNAP